MQFINSYGQPSRSSGYQLYQQRINIGRCHRQQVIWCCLW